MKIYKWFFIILTLAQVVFTLIWFLFAKKIGPVIILSSIIYIGAMFVGYVSYEVHKYRSRKKGLLDNLP